MWTYHIVVILSWSVSSWPVSSLFVDRSVNSVNLDSRTSGQAISRDAWVELNTLPPLMPAKSALGLRYTGLSVVQVLVKNEQGMAHAVPVWSMHSTSKTLWCWGQDGNPAESRYATVFCRHTPPFPATDIRMIPGCATTPCAPADVLNTAFLDGSGDLRDRGTFVLMQGSAATGTFLWDRFLRAGGDTCGDKVGVQTNLGTLSTESITSADSVYATSGCDGAVSDPRVYANDGCQFLARRDKPCTPPSPQNPPIPTQGLAILTECFLHEGLPRIFTNDPAPPTTNREFYCCITRDASTMSWRVPRSNETIKRLDYPHMIVHTSTCTLVAPNTRATVPMVGGTCIAYAVRDPANDPIIPLDGLSLSSFERGYWCDFLCSHPFGTPAANVVEYACNPDIPQTDCPPESIAAQCQVSMLTDPDAFCPAGGIPYRYKAFLVPTGTWGLPKLPDPNARIARQDVGHGYGGGTFGSTNDAFIERALTTCVIGDRYCIPKFLCRCYGDQGVDNGACENHPECNFHGTLYESENPATRPVCQCNTGFLGARCSITMDDVACSETSQEVSLERRFIGSV
jgi:hypothetical protein